MAYQSFIVHVIAISGIFVGLIAANVTALGINNPWITMVAIPGIIALQIYGGNQMKSIGSPPSSTTKTTTEETVTPPK